MGEGGQDILFTADSVHQENGRAEVQRAGYVLRRGEREWEVHVAGGHRRGLWI